MFIIIKIDAFKEPSVYMKGEDEEMLINDFAKKFCSDYGYNEEREHIIQVIADRMMRYDYFNDYEAFDGEGDDIFYLREV